MMGFINLGRIGGVQGTNSSSLERRVLCRSRFPGILVGSLVKVTVDTMKHLSFLVVLTQFGI